MSASPWPTACPAATHTSAIVPARGDLMLFCIFIASRIAICWPRTTVSPGLTLTSSNHAGHRRGNRAGAAAGGRLAGHDDSCRRSRGLARRRRHARAGGQPHGERRACAGAKRGRDRRLRKILVARELDLVRLVADGNGEAVGGEIIDVDDELAAADLEPVASHYLPLRCQVRFCRARPLVTQRDA